MDLVYAWLRLCQPLDLRRREAEGGPLVHRLGAQAEVVLATRLVPVEDRPLHPAAVHFEGYLGKPSEEGGAYPPAAELLWDEDVLEPQRRLAHERGEGEVVEG